MTTKTAEEQAIEHVRKGELASYSKANIQQVRCNDFIDGYGAGRADALRWVFEEARKCASKEYPFDKDASDSIRIDDLERICLIPNAPEPKA